MTQVNLGSLSLKAAEKYIRDIRDNLSEESPEDNLFAAETTTIQFRQEGFGGLTISGDEAKTYKAILRDLHKAVIGKGKEYASLQYVETHFQEAILKAIDLPGESKESFDKRLRDALNDLKSSLQVQPRSWRCYTEVAGISRIGLPFTAGPVTFRMGDPAFAAERVEEWSVMQETTLNPFQKGSAAYQQVEQDLIARYSKGVFTEVDVKATDSRAAEALAVEKVQLAVDVLNFFSDIIFPYRMAVRVYLPEEASNTTREVLSISKDGSWSRHQSLVGPLDHYNFSLITPERAQRTGFDAYMAILSKGERTSMERRVLTACRWAGRATAETRTEGKFLLYAVALESLLLGNKHSTELTYKVSTRCAHLIGDSIEKRKTIQRRTKDLYGVRSVIVHAGITNVSGEDLGSLWRYVKSALIAVVSDEPFTKMTEEAHFEAWFEDRMLDSPASTGESE